MTMHVGDILRRAARLVPRTVAASLNDQQLTFGQADARADRAAVTLAAHGVRQGDRIATWTDISLGEVDIHFATARLGAVYAPLNP